MELPALSCKYRSQVSNMSPSKEREFFQNDFPLFFHQKRGSEKKSTTCGEHMGRGQSPHVSSACHRRTVQHNLAGSVISILAVTQKIVTQNGVIRYTKCTRLFLKMRKALALYTRWFIGAVPTMKTYNFKVCNGFLYQTSPTNSTNNAIPLESAAWYQWLNSHKSFRFESASGNFTVRKEHRAENWYWYAYHRHHGKLSTAYLGKSENLTREQLETTARAFNSSFAQSNNEFPQKTQQQESAAAQADILLITKLQVPPLPPHCVPRPILEQRLNVAMQNKLTLLSAPAGFGKTMALSAWASHCPWPVLWISLDESNNDPVSFWTYVIAALENIQAGMGEHILALLRSEQTFPIKSVITVLINAIAAIPQDFALVFDDYHSITTSAIHQALLFFLKHLPANIHLLIASRVDPPWPLSRLRASRQLTELHATDLRFTSHEVASFFSLLTGLEPSEEIVANLEMFTEGWIAGLQLVVLSSQGLPDMPIFQKAFTGNENYIFDYLADEVWQKQPRHIQTFLLKTAIPERLNASLCDTLTGQMNGQQVLEQLEKANLFIVHLDDRRYWYRFHHLFQEFLRVRLRTLQPEKIKDLHLRSCQWYEQHDLINEAIHHALLAGDFLKVATLVMGVGQRLMQNNEMVTLAQWLAAIPEETLSLFPRLCLLQGWLAITRGQFFPGQLWLQRAQQGIDENTSSPLPHTTQELTMIKGELAAVRSHLAIFQGDILHAQEWANQALHLLSENDLFLRSLSELNLGMASWLNDDIETAAKAMARANTLGETANNLYVRLTAFCILIHIQMEVGQLQRAVQTCHEALQLIEGKKGEALSATAVIYISLGQLLYLWNDLAAADRSLQEGIALCKRWQHRDLMFYGYTIMAQIKQAQGDSAATLKMIQLAEQATRKDQPRYWIASAVAALRIQLALAQKNFEIIEQWQQTEMCSYIRFFEQEALAQIALARNQPEKALTILAEVFQRGEEVGRIGAMIDVRLLQTLAYQQQHASEKALHTLAHALVLAEPGGSIRPFVDANPSLKDLLLILMSRARTSSASSDAASSAFLHAILAAFEPPAPLTASPKVLIHPSQPKTEISALLNTREIAIMRLIVTGLSTREIAQRIVIAESTVKWHIKNIYGKLHVHNRAQVVLRAHEFGID